MMEESSLFVLDISSDEESGFGETAKEAGFGINGVEISEEDCDWLSKLLGEVTESKEDDSDDVVVLSDSMEPPRKTRFGSLKPCAKTGGDIDDDDDECVVLEGDPDKQVAVVNDVGGGGKNHGADEDSDDIEIVGEKGEIACRDFPHARHLCVKFVFSSTQHKVHCSQCHCYVCDALAPCSYWGTGTSLVDHCHASDKEEYWIAERKRVKRGGTPASVLPAQTVPSTVDNNCLLEAFFQATQLPGFPRPQASSPVVAHPCTMSANISVSTAVNQGRIFPVQSRSIRDRSHNAGRTAPFAPPHAVFKRSGLMRYTPRSRQSFRSSLTRDSPSGRFCPLQPQVVDRRYGYPQNVGRQATAPVLPHSKFSLPSMAAGNSNGLPSRLPRQPMPYPDRHIRNTIPYHSETLSQPHLHRHFVRSAVHSQPQLPSQLSTENCGNFTCPRSPVALQPRNVLSYQALIPYHPDAGIDSGDQLNSRYAHFSHSSMNDDIESLSSHPQAHESLISLLFDDENNFQDGNNTHNGLDASSPDSGTGTDVTFSRGDQQAPIEGSQHQTTAAAANDSQPQGRRKDDAHRYVENFHPMVTDNWPGSTPSDLYYRYDYGMTEGHSSPAAWEDPVSPGWQEFAHEHATVDIAAGALFDI